MTPEEAYETVLSKTFNHEERVDAAEVLLEWLGEGGFLPRPTDKFHYLNEILRRNDREGFIAALRSYIIGLR